MKQSLTFIKPTDYKNRSLLVPLKTNYYLMKLFSLFILLSCIPLFGLAQDIVFKENKAVLRNLSGKIPEDVFLKYDILYLDIVNELKPKITFEWKNNLWSVPENSIWRGDTIAQVNTEIEIDVPGVWSNYNGDKKIELIIRRIPDPILTVGSESKLLSDWGSAINIPQGTIVNLKVIDFFISKGTNKLHCGKMELGRQQASYKLLDSDEYMLTAYDGVSENVYRTNFRLYFQEISIIEVESVSLSENSLFLNLEDSVILEATANPSNATDKTLTWSSSNSNVATLQNGKVIALGEGNSIITVASKNGKIATCNIKVEKKPDANEEIESEKASLIVTGNIIRIKSDKAVKSIKVFSLMGETLIQNRGRQSIEIPQKGIVVVSLEIEDEAHPYIEKVFIR